MPKNAIKREGRVNFWKNIDYKKPETRPEPVMSNPNPTRTRRNISKPDPTRTRKKFQNPNPTRTRHLATRPITKSDDVNSNLGITSSRGLKMIGCFTSGVQKI